MERYYTKRELEERRYHIFKSIVGKYVLIDKQFQESEWKLWETSLAKFCFEILNEAISEDDVWVDEGTLKKKEAKEIRKNLIESSEGCAMENASERAFDSETVLNRVCKWINDSMPKCDKDEKMGLIKLSCTKEPNKQLFTAGFLNTNNPLCMYMVRGTSKKNAYDILLQVILGEHPMFGNVKFDIPDTAAKLIFKLDDLGI